MAQEPLTVNLPGCGGVATLRSFIKNKDRKIIQRLTVSGNEISTEELEQQNGDGIDLKLKTENLVGIIDEQVKILLLSYDGVTENPYDAMMDSEFEEDMAAVEEAVQHIFEKKGGDRKVAEKK